MIVNVLGTKKRLKRCGALVVETLEAGPKAGGDKAGVEDLKGAEDACAGAIAHGFHEDAVAVIVVEDKYVIVAGTGGKNEPARLVGMNLSGGRFNDSREAMVCALVVGFAGGKCRARSVIVGVGTDGGRRQGTSNDGGGWRFG